MAQKVGRREIYPPVPPPSVDMDSLIHVCKTEIAKQMKNLNKTRENGKQLKMC